MGLKAVDLEPYTRPAMDDGYDEKDQRRHINDEGLGVEDKLAFKPNGVADFNGFLPKDSPMSPPAGSAFDWNQSNATPAPSMNGKRSTSYASDPVQQPLHVFTNGNGKSEGDDAWSRGSSSTTRTTSTAVTTPSIASPFSVPISPAVATTDLSLPSESSMNEALKLLSGPLSRGSDSMSPMHRPTPHLPPKSNVNYVNGNHSAVIRQESTESQPGASGSVSSMSAIRPNGRKEEMEKRKTIVEKIDRNKEKGNLQFFVPQCEQMTSTQVGMMLRRCKKKASSAMGQLPSHMKKFLFEDEPDEPDDKNSVIAPPASSARDGEYDPYETDISEVDEHEWLTDELEIKNMRTADRSAQRWYVERALIGAQDAKACALLENRTAAFAEARARLKAFEASQESHCDAVDDDEETETCARCRPVVRKPKRHLIHHAFDDRPARVDYSQMAPSTSSAANRYAFDPRVNSLLSMNDAIPIDRRIQTYLHRVSCVPLMTMRKRADESPWMNGCEEEERRRNGFRRQEISEKRRQARRVEKDEGKIKAGRGGGGGGDSSYEDTDDTDDEYEPKRKESRRDSAPSAAARKTYKRGKERNRKKTTRKEGQANPLPLSKLGRRHTVGSRPTRPSMPFDFDEVGFISNLPQKIDYAEISIPTWKDISNDDSTPAWDVPCSSGSVECTWCSEEPGWTRLARMHHVLEWEEKKRFHAFREKVAREAAVAEGLPAKEHPVGKSKLVVPAFDLDTQMGREVPEEDRPSLAVPYPPRQFLP